MKRADSLESERAADLDLLIAEITTDAHGDDEQLWSFLQALQDSVELPSDAFVKDLREIVATLRVCPERVRTLYHHWTTDLETGERLRPPKHPAPPPTHSRQRAPASAVLRGQSSSPPQSLDVRSVPSTDDQPTDLAASSNAITALFEKLLDNH